MDSSKVIEKLKDCIDPELNLDVYTLGLIYDIKIEDKITITMTFTTPFCPYGPMLVEDVKDKVGQLGKEVEVNVTFEPPWQPSDELREMLGV